MGSVYNVSTLGLLSKDVAALERILRLSVGREKSYQVNVIGYSGADILVVNADDNAAVEQVEKNARNKGNSTRIIIYASKTPAQIVFEYTIKIPFLGSKAIRLFDRLVMEKAERGDLNASRVSPDYKEAKIAKPSITPFQQTSALPEKSSQSKLKVLVLDDSAAVRKQMEIILGEHNLIPVLAETGEQAIDILQTIHVDIAFLDVVLPGMDGYKVCKAIKKKKEFKWIPVVMLTSKSSPFDKLRGSLAGCDMYLTKPVAKSKFSDTLTLCFARLKTTAQQSSAGID